MITAIILAAGESQRMGEPKLLMPWGKSTVLQTVISTFQAASVQDILVVTGGAHEQVARLVGKSVQIIYNEEYKKSEMLRSIQIGLTAKMREASSALICLGDQPQVQERSVRSICETFLKTKSNLVVPSYQNRRGHPWLVARALWDDILNMREPETMRVFLNRHKNEIHYVGCETPTILQDLDTPDDYLKYKPAL
jgi:molybdenum cofactor cytidylyltransferase